MNLKNLAGVRFGMLTVERREGVNSSGHAAWLCICECGVRSVATGNNLRAGHTKSCGCLKRRAQSIDLTGSVYGRLYVTGISSKKNNIVKWACVCECGNAAAVTTGHITSGHTKSCGCLMSELSRKNAYKNLAGKRKVSVNGSLPDRMQKDGYIRAHDREHHRATKCGFVLAHIPVMEKKIGRKLKDMENVHHIDGDRGNNNPDNLELWVRSQPMGQRVSDRLKLSVEMISEYIDTNIPIVVSVEDLKKAVWYIEREISKRKTNG